MYQAQHDSPQDEAGETSGGGGCSYETPIRYTAHFHDLVRDGQQHQAQRHSLESITQQQEGHGAGV